MKSRKLVTAISVIAVLVIAAPAFGEGSWSGSMSNVLTGFNSRDWSDKNNDSASTTVRLSTCRTVGPSTSARAGIELRRKRTALPDESFGTQLARCYNSSTRDWGDVKAGTYKFRVNTINDSEYGFSLSANVRVGY